jgi:hypothetical protein
MTPSIAFLAAAVLALAPLPGFAHEPKLTPEPGSDEYSAISVGDHGRMGVQVQQQDDDGPDVLLMALLTVAVAAAAAVLSLIGYVIRQRVGFWLHRPPPRDSSQPQDHH